MKHDACIDTREEIAHTLRPNAYILEDEKTPKPFGVMGPFKAPSSKKYTKYQHDEKEFVSEGLLVA